VIMRALVLGATGHIGAHIVRALLADGHQVRAAYRTQRHLAVLERLKVERLWVDLEEPRAVRRAVDGCEWIFHAAGFYPRGVQRREQALTRGIETTRRVIDECARVQPSRIVFTNSAATIRLVPGRAATEDDTEPWPLVSPRSLYATVKIAMEHEVRQAAQGGVPAVIVNPSICVGEYDAHAFSGRLVLVFARRQMPWYLEHRISTVYTGDVGVGHVRAAQRGQVGARYVLSAHTVAVRAFAEVVAREAGVRPPRWRLPRHVALAAAWGSEAAAWVLRTEPWLPRHAVESTRIDQWLDGSTASRELGLTYTPLEEAVRRAVAWFRQHGYC